MADTTINKKKLNKILPITLIILLLAATAIDYFYNYRTHTQKMTKQSFAMGAPIFCSIYTDDEAYSDKISKEIFDQIKYADTVCLSSTGVQSDIYKLNQNKSAIISPATLEVMKKGIEYNKDCELFDITIGNLSHLWGIDTDRAKVPTQEEINTALSTIDINSIKIFEITNKVVIGKNQKIDLGAIGKGVACDEAKKIFVNQNTKSAIVSVGGSIVLHGSFPNSKDGLWTVGIKRPELGKNDYVISVKVPACFVSTSGDYEKVLSKNGKNYHHILDPFTGYPVDNDLSSVTVFANSGVDADFLSTACFSLGYNEKSLNLLKKYNAQAIFIDHNKKVTCTDEIKDKIKIEDHTYKF
ncbi:MAG: FAD:protein FMN transferase [Clostridia bacterium]|nr:FAD:protein FMN transferase [Clostridia bacterium]